MFPEQNHRRRGNTMHWHPGERIQSVYCSIVGCQAQTTAQDEGDSGQKDAHAEPRLHSASHKTMR